MQELVQLLNSAIVKSKEGDLSTSFEKRLRSTCTSPAMKYICKAIEDFAESENVPKDQAAFEVIKTFTELNKVWSDYIAMEGINVLKQMLNTNTEAPAKTSQQSYDSEQHFGQASNNY